MSPIRIGFIGLTATPGAWANLAHLPYLSQSPHYKIVALANSSVEAAEAAKKAHDLSQDVKAYGSPADLAADPDVDMVVVSVNVARHYELTKPALEAGKMAYVEWPLGNNTAEAEELTNLAKKKNLKTVVGLQGRQTDVARILKEIVESKRLGEVLSSQVTASAGSFDTQVPEKYKYFIDSKVGGNFFTIPFGHFLDDFVDVLGDFETHQAVLANQRPKINILKDGRVLETVHKSLPDHILMQGKLKSGAVASISFGAAKPKGFMWKILCEKGEISLEMPGALLGWSYEKNEVSIKVYENATDKTETIDIRSFELEDIKTPARMIGRVYEAFATGGKYQSFEDGLENHLRLDRIVKDGLHLEKGA